jgi:hypothetical protein
VLPTKRANSDISACADAGRSKISDRPALIIFSSDSLLNDMNIENVRDCTMGITSL